MLDNIGFDLWAKYYDKSTEKSNDEYSYPFVGYYEISENNLRNSL